MNTRTLASLALTLALGAAGANAAQPVTQPMVGDTAAAMTAPQTGPIETAPVKLAPKSTSAKSSSAKSSSAKSTSAKTTSAKTSSLRTGASKMGTKIGTTGLGSGRSVAAPVAGSRKMVRAHLRPHLSLAALKRLHRTHFAHVAKKAPGKHA